MSNLYEEIQKKLDEIDEINEAIKQVNTVMSNPHSTQEDFDHAIKQGIETLEEIERSNPQ